MLLFVILFNLVLALSNFYLVWQLRRLSHFLPKVTAQLTSLEQRIHLIFYPAPEIIFRGQEGTAYLRQRYRSLKIQLFKLQEILSLLHFLSRIWPKQTSFKGIMLKLKLIINQRKDL